MIKRISKIYRPVEQENQLQDYLIDYEKYDINKVKQNQKKIKQQ